MKILKFQSLLFPKKLFENLCILSILVQINTHYNIETINVNKILVRVAIKWKCRRQKIRAVDPTIAISFICQSTNIAISVWSDSIKIRRKENSKFLTSKRPSLISHQSLKNENDRNKPEVIKFKLCWCFNHLPNPKWIKK